MKTVHTHPEWHELAHRFSEWMHSPLFWSTLLLILLFLVLVITIFFVGDQPNPNRVPTQWPPYLP